MLILNRSLHLQKIKKDQKRKRPVSNATINVSSIHMQREMSESTIPSFFWASGAQTDKQTGQATGRQAAEKKGRDRAGL